MLKDHIPCSNSSSNVRVGGWHPCFHRVIMIVIQKKGYDDWEGG